MGYAAAAAAVRLCAWTSFPVLTELRIRGETRIIAAPIRSDQIRSDQITQLDARLQKMMTERLMVGGVNAFSLSLSRCPSLKLQLNS